MKATTDINNTNAHKYCNLAVNLPADHWPEFKARLTACYQASSRAIARDLHAGTRNGQLYARPQRHEPLSIFQPDHINLLYRLEAG
jgi:hypothetical protein